MRRLLLAWLACVLLCVPARAGAHVRSVSFSTWTLVGAELLVRVRVSRLDLSTVPDLSEANFDGYLRAHLSLDPTCAVDSMRPEPAEPGFVVRTFRARCPESVAPRVTSDLFLERVPSHLHFVAVVRDGRTLTEQMLSRDRRSLELPRAQRPVAFGAMVSLGVAHILSGVDHLVFLLVLIVAAGSFRALAGAITGFTAGHSVALALATYGAVRPNEVAIEALIGATIAIVAVENVWLSRRDPWFPRAVLFALGLALAASFGGRHPVVPAIVLGLLLFVGCWFPYVARAPRRELSRGLLTASFGLVHGFAFSSVLHEVELPRGRILAALAGFNVGVELGQLGMIALAWPILLALSRTRARRSVLELSSAAALAAGVFWFVSRGFG